jgi:hypothetical protein
VEVEHAIGGVKIFCIATLPLPQIIFDDLVFEITCELHTFRLTSRFNNLIGIKLY